MKKFLLKPTPIHKQNNISNKELLFLLKNKQIKKIFCFHKWIYWRFGNGGKIHRVCKKCYKKQQNMDVLNTYNIWVKEKTIKEGIL